MTIKAYPKSELAMLYFPEASCPEVAQKHLRRWIVRCRELTAALSGINQSASSKFYSAQAVKLIVNYLGEP